MMLKTHSKTKPGVVVLGGGANTLSVARSLGRRGIKVTCITHCHEYVRFSRYCDFIPIPTQHNMQQFLEDYLLDNNAHHLHGSVLMACSDLGLEVLINKKDELSKKYILDIMNRKAQRNMLDKLSSYKAAKDANVPCPRFWIFKSIEEATVFAQDVGFPIMIKPRFTHKFDELYGRKYLLAHDKNELYRHLDFFAKHDNQGIFLEYIPGPDSQLCSYYTYIDKNGIPLFHFTKRIIRRYPKNEGLGCYHITDNIDEVKQLGLRLLKKSGLIGLANTEFKRDHRDGKLKFIECNARFTAVNCLLEKSGIDLVSFVYDRLIGQPSEPPVSYVVGKRLWYPMEDFASFLQMRRDDEITFSAYVKSLLHFQTFPYFAWDDLLPSIIGNFLHMWRILMKIGSILKR